jgi:ATP-dependent RNA helicase DDX18/HAS1
VNKLDLAKVGKAFGFAVPPRVNISIGGGKSGKRKREDESEDEEDSGRARGGNGRRERERRIEILGKRKVEKEVFRNRR